MSKNCIAVLRASEYLSTTAPGGPIVGTSLSLSFCFFFIMTTATAPAMTARTTKTMNQLSHLQPLESCLAPISIELKRPPTEHKALWRSNALRKKETEVLEGTEVFIGGKKRGTRSETLPPTARRGFFFFGCVGMTEMPFGRLAIERLRCLDRRVTESTEVSRRFGGVECDTNDMDR